MLLPLVSARSHDLQVPTAIPAGMDPATAKEVMEYLRNNPEAAKAALQQAQRMQQQQPGMAQQVHIWTEHPGSVLHQEF